jgi:hypothetical protein
MPRAAVFGCSLLLLCFSNAAGQTFETVGARALGMGGAFVAVADDISAIWWNPAGLATGGFFSLAVERHQFERASVGFFGQELPAERSAFFVGAGSLPLGLSYVRTMQTSLAHGPLDEVFERQLVTHQAGITVLQSITDAIVVGSTLKYVRGVTGSGLPGEPLETEGGHAFDADVSMMAVSGPVKAGLTVRNVFSPEFETPDGGRIELPWLARAGVAYRAAASLTVAFDVDLRPVVVAGDRRRALGLGGEYGMPRVALRAGARLDTIGDPNPLGTVGGSYAVRNGIWVDVWAAGGAPRADRGWGIAGRVVY